MGTAASRDNTGDNRIYVLAAGWRVMIKPDDGNNLYCFLKTEGEDAYPRILPGEVYVTNGNECYNINSAIKKQLVSLERPTLENRARSPR